MTDVAVGEGWDVPAASEPWSDFHWFRVSPRKALVLTVLSEQPLWYTGHYVDNRMCPCLGAECELCKDGVGGQVRYVLAAAEKSTKRVGLVEVGRQIGMQIRDWGSRGGGVRGMTIELMKHSHSKLSRTEVSYVGHEDGPWYRVLRGPDIKNALVLTWRKAGFELPRSLRE